MNLDPKWLQKLEAIKNSPSENFRELADISGLDPKTDFRNTDLSGIDFCNCNLDSFDFSGARLHNCNFKGALITGARFDKAEINDTNLREAADWDKYQITWKRSPNPTPDQSLPTLSLFQDAPFAPEVVVVPSGKFLMGSAEGEGDDDEHPQHEVRIDYSLAVGRFAVTFDEWDFYASQVSTAYKPDDEGLRQGTRPVINVNWDDAQGYVRWLSEATGENYRLLSEAEWEYVCRAGTNTKYWWGDKITHDQANYSMKHKRILSVDSFESNPWALYNVHGNVREWVQDHYRSSYIGSPTDGSAWEKKGDSSASRVLRGGSWLNSPKLLRSAFRNGNNPTFRLDYVGFRISRTLTS